MLLKKEYINLKINNLDYFCEKNLVLIDALACNNIEVPRFCFNENLSIAGNCRMCLIELKNSIKPIASCAINVIPNMEVFTNTKLVKQAREYILEFLLINHPLDCPICDQGGECDLQDQSLFFGITKKRFYSFKRIVTDKNLGPIVKTVMTRCIHCTRCVRFANEIAGVEDLGIFGRGMSCEVGTYINKIFQSELSGNIVDICPVGALTSKPYPFSGRNWELKKIDSIDLSDGFGLNTQIFLKNNKIIKILPGFNHRNIDSHNQWISNKTRFIYDGMFSTNRNIDKFLVVNSQKFIDISWNNLFKKLITIVYLFDHLENHLLKINPFIILFDESSSIEIVTILLLLEKKYSFFELRRAVKSKVSNDFESNLQINTISNPKVLDSSNLCFLIATNTRYESPYLNLKLKKRFLKGNFKIISLGSKTNLTFPSLTLGSNLKKLNNIIEGNSTICTTIKNSTNLLTVLNTETLQRQDSPAIMNFFASLNKNYKRKTWNAFNLLNTSLNSTGISNLACFKVLSKNDLIKTNGLFFINSNLKTSFITEKIIELELLNYFSLNLNFKVFIEQNNQNNHLTSKNKLNIPNYIFLPNNTFFEDSGNYINTEGEIKQTIKLISSMQNTKNNWHLLRKLTSTLKNVEFTNNIKYNTRIFYNSNNLFNFKNFISFLYLNSCSLSKLSFHLKKQTQVFTIFPFKVAKVKNFTSQLKKWIEDFYLGGYDNYSKSSATMISCSINLRQNTNTFQN